MRVFTVGVVEEGVTVRTVNGRFVLENDDHIQLCENSSCSRLEKRERRQRMREEMQPRRECVRVCVCVRLPLPFDSCMQMKPHKQVHRGKGQHSFPLGEKQHFEDSGFKSI